MNVGKYTMDPMGFLPSLFFLNLRDLFQTKCSRDFFERVPMTFHPFLFQSPFHQASGPCPFWCGLCHFKGVRWGR